MARTRLTEDIWQYLQNTMKFHGYYFSKNSRNIFARLKYFRAIATRFDKLT